jgi:hypothetical protein
MDVEHLAKSVGIVVLGVIVAGFVLHQLAPSVSLIATAQAGFTGGN